MGLLLLAVAQPASADDASMGVPFAELTTDAAGSVVTRNVAVTLEGRKLSLAMQVISREPATDVRFRLPLFGWLGASEPYPDRQFPELAASLDGANAPIASVATASFGGRDISATLRAATLDPYAIATTPPFVEAGPGDKDAFAELVRLGAVQQDPDGFLAKWAVSREGRIAMPSAGPHEFTLSYTARPGFALLAPKQLIPLPARADYCLSSRAADAILSNRRGQTAILRFTIPVGIDSRFSTLRLTVEALPDSAGLPALIVFCGANGRSEVRATRVDSVLARANRAGVLAILVVGEKP